MRVRSFLLAQLAILAVAVVLIFPSCRNSASEDDGIVIGLSVASDDFLLERWNKDVKIFTSKAADLGAEVVLAKSPGGALSQIPQIQYLLDSQVDVIVVIPQDMELLDGIIRKAMDKGIPVVSYDRPVMGVEISGYVSFDNREVGRLLAQALLGAVPRGEYIIVNGSIHDNNSYEINRGMRDILGKAVDRGDVTIVDEIWLDLWSFDEALAKLGPSIDEHPGVQAIFCSNDVIATAAVQLLAQRRRAGDVTVVGQDADLVACQRIVEGTQLMTVYKPISQLAGRAARLSVDLARGGQLEPDREFENGSDSPVPFYLEEPVAVYRNNLDETVIRDGFHSREDVYREDTGQN